MYAPKKDPALPHLHTEIQSKWSIMIGQIQVPSWRTAFCMLIPLIYLIYTLVTLLLNLDVMDTEGLIYRDT